MPALDNMAGCHCNMNCGLQEAEAAEKAEEAARAAKKAAFKASLDKQVKEAAARKVQQPMSPVERCINKDLLDKIQTYQETGLV